MGQVCTLETSRIHDEWNDGWGLDEWNDYWSGVGWHEGCEQTYNRSVSSFSLESSVWVSTYLDTGAAVNTFPSNFGPDGVGDGSFFDWIPDGEAWQFQGYDENALPRSLNGRLTGVHKVLCSAAEIAYKEQQDFCVGHNGGHMIPIHSKNGQGMRLHSERLLEYRMNDLIPVYPEEDALNFYLNREVKSEEIYSVNDAKQCLEKESQQSDNECGKAVRS